MIPRNVLDKLKCTISAKGNGRLKFLDYEMQLFLLQSRRGKFSTLIFQTFCWNYSCIFNFIVFQRNEWLLLYKYTPISPGDRGTIFRKFEKYFWKTIPVQKLTIYNNIYSKNLKFIWIFSCCFLNIPLCSYLQTTIIKYIL